MTALTNAPPLPDEPDGIGFEGWKDFTHPKVLNYIADLVTVATTLRAQLEQSPMRESAIIEGLERQLAEARGEIERLRERVIWKTVGRFDVPVTAAEMRELEKRADEQTARADACEKDAKRYRWLRENNIIANVRFNFANGETPFVYAEALDAAVDAALSGAPT